jgi:hypothetical protein
MSYIPKIIEKTEAAFEAMRERGAGQADRRYHITPRRGDAYYAWTVDGEGYVFWDTEEELRSEVG